MSTNILPYRWTDRMFYHDSCLRSNRIYVTSHSTNPYNSVIIHTLRSINTVLLSFSCSNTVIIGNTINKAPFGTAVLCYTCKISQYLRLPDKNTSATAKNTINRMDIISRHPPITSIASYCIKNTTSINASIANKMPIPVRIPIPFFACSFSFIRAIIFFSAFCE